MGRSSDDCYSTSHCILTISLQRYSWRHGSILCCFRLWIVPRVVAGGEDAELEEDHFLSLVYFDSYVC